MSKLTDDLRTCDPITSPNVAGILLDAAAGRIEMFEESVKTARRLMREYHSGGGPLVDWDRRAGRLLGILADLEETP